MHWHHSQWYKDAEHRSEGSQGGCPIRTEGLRILRFKLGREKVSVEMNFVKQDVKEKGNDVHYYSEMARKLCRMRETRVKLFS